MFILIMVVIVTYVLSTKNTFILKIKLRNFNEYPSNTINILDETVF